MFSHIDANGNAKMVDVTKKGDTLREAIAMGSITLNKEIIKAIIENKNKKGDVLSTSKIAGIQAAKKTADLIPLTHNLNLTKIAIDFSIDEKNYVINCEGLVRCLGKTGVEMEALTAVSVALLTVYDMCKSFSKNLVISKIMLLKKSGGKSGSWSK
ncbi:MAG: cyclic pyranopterin monophosphate synthase MoaC [Nitrosomonadales bacterium]|jgi:cyclic pyranopterin phosphate synthase|nr:cyclic pyranopterin monophosphate synthase MoaC [Nitrosomonadales bacterium]MBT5572706.1 cyclic pyranopterin monophosphate synthase MoaC [Nitrosomonadales bacterium]